MTSRQFLRTCRFMTGSWKNLLAEKPTLRTILRLAFRGTKSNAASVAVMAVKLVIAPEAEQDLAEAYAWYERQRAGFGEEFLGCVDACIEALSRSPGMYAVVHENCRRALVRRFPYAIFYEHVEDMVTV